MQHSFNFHRDGYEIIESFLPDHIIKQIREELVNYPEAINSGLRNADKKLRTISHLANSTIIQTKAKEVLWAKPQLVRAIVFDKTTNANWGVAWHQDKTIAVSHKLDRHGWGPWSLKDGVHHVQPLLRF